MKADILRKSILQYAIQGKLVPQIPSEESAHILLEKIKKEKQDLIKQGKLKKEKPLAKIAEDETPFDIPESWTWVRLGTISNLYTGDSINEDEKRKKYTYIKEGLNYIGTKDVNFDTIINYENGIKIPDFINFEIARVNSILLCIEGGSAGRKIGITNQDVCFGNKLCCFSSFIVESKYLFYFLRTPIFIDNFKTNKTGMIGGVGVNTLKTILFSLPPLEEQKRIVAKIEELMALVDKYEIYETELDKLESEFPERLKKSILQYAIQGKLVPQIPTEESAYILLEKIKKEKQDLIKQGKLKKEKPLAEIIEGEMPQYDIPDSWTWQKLGNLGDWGAGATPLRTEKKYYENGTINWLKTGELNNSIVHDSEEKITEYALKENSLRVNKPGDVLIAMYGATIGKLAIVGKETTTNQACCGCAPFSGLNNIYLFYLLKAIKTELIDKGEGGAQPNISRIKIRNIIVGLPPFEEQKRIVAKIEEIFAFIDLLSNDKKIEVRKIDIPSSIEVTKNIKSSKPKFDVSDFELAARQTADVSKDTIEEIIKQVKEHYDSKN